MSLPKVTTTYSGRAAPKRSEFNWSYSKLKNFRNCPKKHYEVDLAKNFKEERSQALADGEDIHKAMELRLKAGTPLPPAIARYEQEIVKVIGNMPPGTILLVEEKAAIRQDFSSCGYFDPGVWLRMKIDVAKIYEEVGAVVDWKGLSTTTPIPVPGGFKTMGELRKGDLVFGTDGGTYPVLGKSEVKNLPCYKVEFTSGFSITCDHEHLWGTHRGVWPVTKLRPRDKILLPAPVSMPDPGLPVDPYVLGFWLADGKSTSGEATKPDIGIWDEITRRGYDLGLDSASARGQCRTHTIKGIRGHLSAMGLLGRKHIPAIYQWASVSQRQDLVRGFADGDGTVNKLRRQVCIEITDGSMAQDLALVLRSLGERVLVSAVTRRGFGKTVQAFMISWRPRTFNPFLCARKRLAAAKLGHGRDYLEVRSIREVPSEPTQCISVGSPDRMYLCGREFVPTHNTGKIQEDSEQLALNAQWVFSHFPRVQVVRSRYVWLGNDAQTEAVFTRNDMKALWAGLWPELQLYENAVKTLTFPPKPSGLCRQYCPVTSCPYHGKGNR